MPKAKTNFTADVTVRLGKSSTIQLKVPVDVATTSNIDGVLENAQSDFSDRVAGAKFKINNASELKAAMKAQKKRAQASA